ncbi:MAG: thiol:disulfide interchange protein DsbA/DsbL [Pseudomonadales bacterium]|nr:thiol:disulfide interchange protein DsbA/DsbL [Pseudomonadales bacterium]
MLIRTLLKSVVVLIATVTSFFAIAENTYVEGTHYEVIDIPVETGLEAEQQPTVEVVEVFSYMCVHCYTFDPLLERWEQDKSEQTMFSRMPAVFSPDWALMAQAFYTVEVLGVSEQMHDPLFAAIHTQPKNLRDEDVMAALFEDNAGVSPAEFDKTFNSFFVRSRVMQAQAKGRAYGITGVPMMIVNGKYRVGARMAGSNQGMLDVVDFLVQKELAAQ